MGKLIGDEGFLGLVRFQGAGDFRGVSGEAGAIDVAGAGKVDGELFADAAWVWGEEDHAIAEASGFADIMGDKDDGFFASGPDFLEIAVELFAGHGVEGGEGFVHEEDAGVGGEGAGEGDALAHPAGEFVDIGVGVFGEADEMDIKEGDFAAFVFVEIGFEFEAEEDIAEDIEPREEGGFLKHHHAIAAGFGDLAAIGGDGAGVGEFEARDHGEEGRFSATAGADEADELALFHGEADIVEGLSHDHAIAESFGDGVDEEFHWGNDLEFFEWGVH